MANDTGITRADILRYGLLPGIVPRLRTLLGGGFGYLSLFIAVVFNTLRILPNDHPSLKREGHKNYSVIRIIAEAANHIDFNRKNLDKVTIFFVVLAGLIMMALQAIILIVQLFTGPALAQTAQGEERISFFTNPNPENDVVFRLLDLVFGIEGIFGSQDEGTSSLHAGLHALFEFYSYGVLLVGVFVLIYLAITIVLETAQSGVPFGKRFNHAWAPIRLILFFGLLIPTASGINVAQYMLLNAAKLGSNLGTNGWLLFDREFNKSPYLGDAESLIGQPGQTDLSSLIYFMQMAKTCSWAEGRSYGRDIQPYIIAGNEPGDLMSKESLPPFNEYVAKSRGGTIFIRFGERDDKLYANERGHVFPHCGELALSVVDMVQPGSAHMQQSYLELVACMWHGTSLSQNAQDGLANSLCRNTLASQRGRNYADRYTILGSQNPFPDMRYTEWDRAKLAELRMANMYLTDAIEKAREIQVEEGDWVNDPALERGWGGAGIWYNKIAEQNGALTAAVMAKPEISQMPYVMEYMRKQQLRENPHTPYEYLYTPSLGGARSVSFEEPQQREVLLALNQLFAFWGRENVALFIDSIPESKSETMTNNIIIDTMNVFLGTNALFDMCKNADIHPLAQLSTLGRGLIESAVRGFGLAAGTGLAGGLLALLQAHDFAQALSSATSFFTTFAGLGLMIGFLLFYVIPFMPFIYFFFAISTWIKSIFEAMVGMPLWALAHLRIDGQGMPGEAAASGYFYIFEIFLRPLIIVISFVGAIAIYGALVRVLNEVFGMVVGHVGGYSVSNETGCFGATNPAAGGSTTGTDNEFSTGIINEFFYTVVYAILVYLLAMPCFKLVDLIPDNVMRWFGAGIQTFGANDGDPVEGMIQYTAMGGGLIGNQLQSGIGGAMSKLNFLPKGGAQ